MQFAELVALSSPKKAKYSLARPLTSSPFIRFLHLSTFYQKFFKPVFSGETLAGQGFSVKPSILL